MNKIEQLKQKLNPKVAMIGGAIVVTTSLGTCQWVYEDSAEPAAQEPVEAPEELVEAPTPASEQNQDQPAAEAETE
jgi:hypothetical protein